MLQCESSVEARLQEALQEIQQLKMMIRERDEEIITLKLQIGNRSNSELEKSDADVSAVLPQDSNGEKSEKLLKSRLTKNDIERYSRQLILPEFNVKGQIAVCNSSVLIVGCGGLGCPAAIYLAAAGVGRLGLVDYDVVEISNLHRQVLHDESKVNCKKCLSLAANLHRINSTVKLEPIYAALDSSNAIDIISQYDVVVDASDNVATRYLLNDACVLLDKPLVSGSALRFEGQLTIYGYNSGPCYRCLFPTPPPPSAVTNCSEGGVLGAVVGVIGSLQAMETIKILTKLDGSLSGRLLIYDGETCSFRTVKLRGRQPNCAVCGSSPSITQLIDYEQFCGAKASDKGKSVLLLASDERICAQDYRDVVEGNAGHLLIDVRDAHELDICKLATTTHNIPLKDLEKSEKLKDIRTKLQSQPVPVYVVCRRGNDSQLAVARLRQLLADCVSCDQIKDITGGLHAWAQHVDADFPVY